MPPLLSAIMIVKNEESNLPRCLESVRKACDEICIVDTGSTDRTVEIAESFGTKISRMEWNGNESDARNESARMATGKWIFVVDADEAISPELAEEIKRFLPRIDANPEIQSASVVWRNHYSDGSTSLTRITRLGRNTQDFHFEGNIHPTASYGNPVHSFESPLDHYGYVWTPEQRDRKSAHMLAHLRPLIEGDKPPLSRLSQYATYLLVSGKDDEFAARLEQILKRYSKEERLTEPYWKQAVPNLLQHLAGQDRFEEGSAIAWEILENSPELVGANFFLLQDAVRRKDWDLARHLAKEVLALLEKPVGMQNVVYPEVQRPAALAWSWLAEIASHPEEKNNAPASILHPRNAAILLHATSMAPLACENAAISSLLKISSALRQYPAGSNPDNLERSLRLRIGQSDPASCEYIVASLLFIEFCFIGGKIQECIPVVEKLLAEHGSCLWLAHLFRLADKDWKLSHYYERIIHHV